MHFIIIQDELKKLYYVLKTPFLPEFYSIIRRKYGKYKLKVFENTYPQRLMKIFYVRFLLNKKYKYRRKLLSDFLSDES